MRVALVGIIRVAVVLVVVGTLAASCPTDAETCDPGFCLNSFASKPGACCPANSRFYCDGTNACYQTFEDAYVGRSCTLPKDRVCF